MTLRKTLVATWRWPAPALVTLLVLAPGCAKHVHPFDVYRREVDHRVAVVPGPGTERWYEREDTYLARRRHEAKIDEAPVRGSNLKGIALSGGGIRSATFSLGVLQALARTDRLRTYDYLSGTSGGAYLAAWLLAHYTTATPWLQRQKGVTIDGQRALGRSGWEVRSSSLTDLLLGTESTDCGTRECEDQLLTLQAHSGFLNHGGLVEGADWLWAYAWRLPFSLLFDVALHTKSDWNWYHLIAEYSDSIGSTYLRGIEDVPLTAINRAGGDAPYGIINGNLLNDTWEHALASPRPGSNPFEFTADLSGADALGYIDSQGLDALPTGHVVETDGVVSRVDLRSGCPQQPADGSELREFCGLRLRDAVAASGAAFDPDGVLTRVNNYPARQAASFVAAPLNFNLGLETWNYASELFGLESPLGYAAMQTSERLFNPSPDARWIKITDGGHFENTSVFSLLRRGVGDILAVDATGDPHTTYDDRKVLAELVRDRLELVASDPGEWFTPRTVLHRVKDANLANAKPFAVITWIKPARCFCATASPELLRVAVKACEQVNVEPAFPHTSTIQQWYSIEEFEAYRTLGYAQAMQVIGGSPVADCGGGHAS